MAATLWCMRVIGPDEVHAYATRQQAEAAVAQHEAVVARRLATDPVMLAEFPPPWSVVDVWPWSAEAHAENMVREGRADG